MWLPVFFNKMPLRVPTAPCVVATRSVHDTQRGARLLQQNQKRPLDKGGRLKIQSLGMGALIRRRRTPGRAR